MAFVEDKSALVRAVKAKNLPLVTTIINSTENISAKIKSIALSAAITNQLESIISVLLDNDCTLEEVPHEWYHLLNVSIDNQFLNVLDHLLNSVKVIERKPDLLHEAVAKEDLQVAEWLINNNADMNCTDSTGRSLLRHILEDYKNIYYKNKMLQLLLNNGATCKDEPHLFANVIQGFQARLIELFLLHDTCLNINAVDANGDSPLLLFIQAMPRTTRINVSVLTLMINCGANVNHQDIHGLSALHLACLEGNKKLVKILLEANANVHLRNYADQTPLHTAARFGAGEKICLMLLEAGADVNAVATDKNLGNLRQTPLEYACLSGQSECVSLLFDYGADIYASDYSYSSLIRFVGFHICDLEDSDYSDYSDSDDSDSDEEDDELDYHGIIDILEGHIVKLIIVGFHVSESDWDYANMYLEDHETMDSCMLELDVMKTKFFGNGMSYLDVITLKPERIARLFRNEEIMSDMTGKSYKKAFPQFGPLLARHIKTGKEKAILLDTSSRCLDILSGNRFPYLVTEKVLSYLNDQDMRNLASAVNEE